MWRRGSFQVARSICLSTMPRSMIVHWQRNVEGDGDGIAAAPPARAVEGESNAVTEDVAARLVPGGTIHLPLDDGEIDADIDEDGADRAATVLGGCSSVGGVPREGSRAGSCIRGAGFVAEARLAGLARRAPQIAQVLAAGARGRSLSWSAAAMRAKISVRSVVASVMATWVKQGRRCGCAACWRSVSARFRP